MNSHAALSLRTARTAVSALQAVTLVVAVLSSSAQAAEPSPASASSQPATVVSSTLDLWEIAVYGNSVLPDDDIYATIQPFLGPQRSLDDVDRARDALETLYRERGYKTVAVTIPRQTARDGVVRLDVIESRVGHLTVVGSRYHSLEQIKIEAGSLAEGKVPDFTAVQQDIVALNRSEDLKVTPTLRAGSAPGTVDVDLAVSDTLPLHGSVELNNRYSQNTSELRALAAVSYANLFQRGHSLSLSAQVAPLRTDDARVLFASYLVPFGRSPYSLLVNGIKSDSNVASVGGASVIGRGEIGGIRLFVNLQGSDNFFPSASIGADYKHFRSAIALGGQAVQSPITYVPFSAALNAVLRDHGAVNQLSFSVMASSPQIGSTSDDYGLTRQDARGQQLVFRQSFSRTQPLPFRLVANVRLSLQQTDQPLISNEQFTAGGADTVRGYRESEVLGDYGYVGGLDLRYAPLPDDYEFFPGFAPLSNLRLYGFVDGARLFTRNSANDQNSLFTLWSTGAGLSFTLFSAFEGNFVAAFPLLNGTATRADSTNFLFRVSSSF